MNDLERKAAEVQLGVLKLQHLLLKSQLKGDLPGHPFRGNQWNGGMMAPDRDMGSGIAQPAQITSETGQKAARIIRKLIMSGGDVGDTTVTDDVAALLADSVKNSPYKVFRGVHVMKNRVSPQQYEELKKLNPGDSVPEHLQKRGNDYASTSASAAVARYYAKDGDVELVMSSSPRKEQILADLRNLQQAFAKHGLEKEFAAEFDEDDVDYFKKDKEVFVKRGTEFTVESIKIRHKSPSFLSTKSPSEDIFDPRDWDDELIDTCLPILMRKAGEAAAAQMLIMGVDVAPRKKVGRTEKGDLPGHPFRGNQWGGGSGGLMAPDTGGSFGGGGHTYSFDGKYLNLPDGEVTSIPREGEGSVVFGHPVDGTFHIAQRRDSSQFVARGDKYDEDLKDGKELVNWLNSGKLRYMGNENPE